MFQGQPRHLARAAVEVAGEGPFDAAACLPHGLARHEEPLVVGAGFGVVADPLEGDDVERPVELAIAATVQPVASLLATRGIDRALPASAAKDASLPIRVGSPLDALAQPTQNAVHDVRAAAASSCLGEVVPREPSQALADLIGSGHEDRTLSWLRAAERARIALRRSSKSRHRSSRRPPPRGRPRRSPPKPPRRQDGVDEIALPAPSLLTARTLTLVHADAGLLEEANEPRTVTAAALDREGRHPELLRPGKQAAVAGQRGRRQPASVVGISRLSSWVPSGSSATATWPPCAYRPRLPPSTP
jgi:hypothetical protein